MSATVALASGKPRHRAFAGVVVSYLEAGSNDARAIPLLILHGIGSAARSFQRQLDGLSATRRVIAWDAPGYVDSTALEPFAPTAEDYATRLAAFLDDLAIERCHLLGHSLGCLMAARFALRYPGRVRSLSLCSIAAGQGTLAAEERQKLLDQRVNDIATLGPREMARLRGPRLLAPGAPDDIVQKVVDTMGSVHLEGYSQAARMLSTGNIKADIAKLPASLPLQIVYGDADVITPPARNLEVAGLRPDAPVTVIANAGHALYLEQPDAFNAAITGFIDAART